jgi:hypothetical protein
LFGALGQNYFNIVEMPLRTRIGLPPRALERIRKKNETQLYINNNNNNLDDNN